jgi:hypothetical protein
MALSDPKINFSVHSITPYARFTKTIGGTTFYKGLPFGMFQVVGDASFNLNASSVQVYGGSSYFARASEITQIDAEATFTVKESPDMLYSLFGGATITKTAASATGTVFSLQNANGTSVFDATTGVASATVKTGSEADLKFGHYVVRAVSATTVDVYAMTDLQFQTGTAINFEDDELKITASALTIATGAAVEVPDTGIELTGGSGSISMTQDDTAVYQVIAEHGGISTIDIGKKGLTFPNHGLILYGKERSDATIFAIEIFKAQASAGMVLPMSESDFQITDIAVKALIDNDPIDGSGDAKLARIISVTPA